MIRRIAAAAAALALLAGPAFAQEQAPAPAASTRCGGVLCDLYYAGKPVPAPGQPDVPSPTSLPCHDFVCGMFGGRTPDAPPPAVQQAAAEPAPTEAPAKHGSKAHHARKKHMAKVKTAGQEAAAKTDVAQ